MKAIRFGYLVLAGVMVLLLVCLCTGAMAEQYGSILNTSLDKEEVDCGGSYVIRSSIRKTYTSGDVFDLWFYGEIYKNGELYDKAHANLSLTGSTYNYTSRTLTFQTDPNDPDAIYGITCWITDKNGGGNVYSEVKAFSNLTVKPNELAILSVEPEQEEITVGSYGVWNTAVHDDPNISGTTISYSYRIINLETGSIFRNTTNGMSVCSCQFNKAGRYGITAYAQKGTVQARWSGRLFAESTITVIDPNCPRVYEITSEHQAVAAGQENTWQVTGKGGTGALEYQYSLYRDGVLTEQTEWTEQASITRAFATGGSYVLRVNIQDAQSHEGEYRESAALTVTRDLLIDRITTDNRGYLDTPVTWSAYLTGDATGAQYRWKLYRDDIELQDTSWTNSNIYTYTPDREAAYRVEVAARDAYGGAALYTSSETLTPIRAIGNVTLEKDENEPGNGVNTNWTAKATGGYGRPQYHFELYRGDTLIRDYGWTWSGNTVSSAYGEAGTYTMQVTVRDEDERMSEPVRVDFEIVNHVPQLYGINPGIANTVTLPVPAYHERGRSSYFWSVHFENKGDGNHEYNLTLKQEGETVYQSGWTALDGTLITLPIIYPNTGIYEAMVYVRDMEGDVSNTVSVSYPVYDPLNVSGITIQPDPPRASQAYTITPVITGGKEPYTITCQQRWRLPGVAESYLDDPAQEYSDPTIPFFSTYPTTDGDYYRYVITVKDANYNQVSYTSGPVYVTPAPMITGITSQQTEALAGENTTWSIAADKRYTGTLTYHIQILRNGEPYETREAAEQGSSYEFTYMLPEDGTYKAAVYVTGEGLASPTVESAELSVTDRRPRITGITSLKEQIDPRERNSWTISAEGYGTEYSYFFRLTRNGKLYQVIGWRDEPECSFTFNDAGEYRIEVRVSNSEGYNSAFKTSEILEVRCPGHIAVEDAAVEATCTKAGLTKGSHCELCGKILEEQETIAPKGHVWGPVSYTWTDDHTQVTAERICIHDESHKETETVSARLIRTQEATCTENAEEEYISSDFTNSAFTVQTLTVKKADALGHQWSEPTYEWEYDSEWKPAAVTAQRTCKRDGMHTESETVSLRKRVVVYGYNPETEEYGPSSYYNGYSGEIEIDAVTKPFTNTAFEEQATSCDWRMPYEYMEQSSLPGQLATIGEEAFAGTDYQVITVPEGCTTIGPRAFADCKNLQWIIIHNPTTKISEDAFEGSDQVIILCHKGSEADQTAQKKGIMYLWDNYMDEVW